MDIGQLEGLMLGNKKFALAINKIIGLRIKKLERRLDALVFRELRTRLVEFKKDLLRESGMEKERGILVSHFYTHKDMADLIGTTRQTVTTVFYELKQQGVLEFWRKEIFIPEPSAEYLGKSRFSSTFDVNDPMVAWSPVHNGEVGYKRAMMIRPGIRALISSTAVDRP
jgi:hypothetical protein